jgi:hypothetical protein
LPGDDSARDAVRDLRGELRDFILQQDERMEDLQSRLDFAERLLANPRPGSPAGAEAKRAETPV